MNIAVFCSFLLPSSQICIGMYNKDLFDRLINGKPVSLYQVKNSHNTIVHITNYGCRIVSLFVNDKNKKPVKPPEKKNDY